MSARKTLVIAALVSVFALASFLGHDWSCKKLPEFSPEITLAFSKWSDTFARKYQSPEEKMHRLRIFAESYEKVRIWRLNYLRDHELELNKFADLSDEEFGAKFGTSNIEERINAKYRNDGTYGGPNYGRSQRVGANPQSLDWRTKNAIPPVQTQADCSLSVGAYTAAAAATANLFIHDHEKGKQVLFSVQRLLDCRVPSYVCGQTYYDHDAYSMLIQKPATPDDYYGPFTGIPTTCKNSEAGIHQKFTKWSDVYPTEDIDLENTIQEKVMTVMVYMPTSDVKLYKSGVFTSSSCQKTGERLYYQPMIVGYNNASSQNRKKRFGEKNDFGYWITQWAFGPDWGENGYMRIQKETDKKSDDYNACSINSYPYYITPKSAI